MIEAMKQALEALERSVATCYDQYAHQQVMSQPNHFINQTITSLRHAIAKAEDNYQGSDAAKAAHMMDLYTALGVRWGDNPFAVIAKMRSITELESQEPVAYINVEKRIFEWAKLTSWETPTVVNLPKIPLYIHPPQRTWIGLTDEEVMSLLPGAVRLPPGWIDTVRAIEARLKEKNNV